jgi:hypothetical protein
MDNAGNGTVVEGSIVKVEHAPHELAATEYHRRATDVAGLVRAIVTGKAVQIGPRKYVPVDAYQAIANAMGCVASARDVRRVEGGYTAIGEVKRLSDGKVLAEGEGFVGDDEPKWKNGPEYARRSMVQTRAIGRACRAAFAFVVPMIDLGLSSTTAEEMEGINTGSETPPPPPRGTAGLKAALSSPPPSPPQAVEAPRTSPSSAPAAHNRELSFKFGRDKNTPLHALPEASVRWYADCIAKDIANPGKANFAASNTQALATVQAELRYRGL